MLGYTKRVLAGAIGSVAGSVMCAALPAMLLLCDAARAAGPSNLRFEHVSIEQGLSQESVLNILQDRQGFMWFGTQAGLNRYDGYKITAYRADPLDPGSLPDSFVNASFEDAGGRLWFGTKGGLARFDAASGKFVRYRLGDNRSVSAITADRHGALWLGTADGLKRFDPASGAATAIGHAPARAASPATPGAAPGNALDGNTVTALAFDGHGVLWVGTNRGVARLAPGAAQLEHVAPPGPDPRSARILALSLGPRGTLWVGTEAGLEAWNIVPATPQRRTISADEGVGEFQVPALYHDSAGTLWAGTDLDGLKWRDPASGRFVAYRSAPLDPHSLSDNQVASVRVDRTGTLWVGSRFGGVSRTDLASGGFSHYSYRPASGYRVGFEKTRDIAVREDGKIWLGTIGAGLVLLDPATGRTEQPGRPPGRPGAVPFDVIHSLRIEGGRLWVGGAGVLAWCDVKGGRFHQVALPGIGTASVQDVVRTRDGVLWVVTRAGLYEMKADLTLRKAWRNDPLNPASLGDNTLFAMVEDKDGMLWIGTDSGLDRFDRRSGAFTHFRHDPRDLASLRHHRVYTVTLASNGQLWLGTAGGLHRLEKNPSGKIRFRYFPITGAREALPIGGVLEDAHGRLWASMTNGISRLDPDSGAYKHYTAKDGLLDGTYFVGSSAHGPDGRLHFGGVNGISSFLPDAIRDNPYPPVVRITDFRVSYKSRPLPRPAAGGSGNGGDNAGGNAGGNGITLTHREAVFGFEFAALHYAAPASNRYAYRLEGFDEDWVETDAGKRFASYTNLDPGRYVFRVRGSNKDGIWSEAPTALRITIEPPWWKTPWFRLLAFILAVSAVALAYRLRVRVLVQQKGRLERKVAARTAELVLQKDAAEDRKREAERQREAADEAYRQLKDAQAQLAAREKLASLGSLVAGVAHELNTPIGNSLLMASTLHDKTLRLAHDLEGGALRRSGLAAYVDAAREASELIERSLHGAAELVNSFRQVSVDQASAQRRRFGLARACHEIVATMMNKVRLAGHTLEMDVPEDILMDSYPGPFGQVVINFVDNALLHAFEAPGGGMRLSARRLGEDRVRIDFLDDGRGIPTEHLARVFDPFFTTRMGQGGTGLGLNIAHTIATTLLGGTIRVESAPGQGTLFVLELPLVAS